jgi:hypothetical protein
LNQKRDRGRNNVQKDEQHDICRNDPIGPPGRQFRRQPQDVRSVPFHGSSSDTGKSCPLAPFSALMIWLAIF